MTDFSDDVYGRILQSFSTLEPCPFIINFMLAFIFKCNSHISKSNQQPMNKTKTLPYIYIFFYFSIICYIWMYAKI